MNRSLLFVPATMDKLCKISEFNADSFIIDLEDSIECEYKNHALKNVCQFLSENHSNKKYIVRVNKDNYIFEIKSLAKYGVAFMLPKYESKNDYEEVERYLLNNELYALIESPKGFVNLKEIVEVESISAMAFGAEDFTSEMGMENTFRHLMFYKHILILYAKANRKKVYDTPCFNLNSDDCFLKEVQDSYELGFDGKMCIHPKHIEDINRIFTRYETEKIRKIISQYESEGKAVQVIEGKVYERMHIERMKNVFESNNIV